MAAVLSRTEMSNVLGISKSRRLSIIPLVLYLTFQEMLHHDFRFLALRQVANVSSSFTSTKAVVENSMNQISQGAPGKSRGRKRIRRLVFRLADTPPLHRGMTERNPEGACVSLEMGMVEWVWLRWD